MVLMVLGRGAALWKRAPLLPPFLLFIDCLASQVVNVEVLSAWLPMQFPELPALSSRKEKAEGPAHLSIDSWVLLGKWNIIDGE